MTFSTEVGLRQSVQQQEGSWWTTVGLLRSSRAQIHPPDALLLPLLPCVAAKPNCGSSILHSKDNGGELGSENQNKLRKNSDLRMGRKKKEKEPSGAESKGKEEKDGNEAEVEPEKRAGRRSSKPVVAKWAIGGENQC